MRKLAQYFYPQAQTKVMNEGWATFWHYTILNRLHEKGLVDDGFMLEFLKSHTNVHRPAGVRLQGLQRHQPVCARVLRCSSDIRRICEAPTAEDRDWFPDIAGTDWRKTLDFAMRNFKDESFIAQFLSPRLIRELRLFAVADHEDEDALFIDSIHDDDGYRRVRKLLAQQYAHESRVPDVQVRALQPRRRPLADAAPFHPSSAAALADAAGEVVKHLRRLWGFAVRLETWDGTERVGSLVECPG